MRGASQIDLDATERRCFLDTRSVVFHDGREALFGADWVRRKGEVYNDANGLCHYCGTDKRVGDVHHDPIRRSVRRDDRMSNLKLACRPCHNVQHPEKQPQWSVRA